MEVNYAKDPKAEHFLPIGSPDPIIEAPKSESKCQFFGEAICKPGNFIRILLPPGIIFLFILYFRSQEYGYLAGGIFLFIMYWVDICCINTTLKYVSNLGSIDQLHSEIVTIKLSGRPSITWNIQCYHYETTVRHYTTTDSNGNTHHHTETTQHKVTTWEGTQAFAYDEWFDSSPDTLNVDDFKYIRWSFAKHFDFADELSRISYQNQKNNFENANKNRDTHYSLSEKYDIEGYRDRSMTSRDGQFNTCMDPLYYILACLLMLELVYSVWLKSIAIKKYYGFHKTFKCHQVKG